VASYIATRFVRMITVVFAVTLFAFFLLNLLPGSPINAILGAGAGDAAARAQVSAQLGLNHPLAERYFIWLGHALQGNLGVSYVSNQSVLSAIGERIPLTLELMVMAEVISIVLAVPTAMGCALKPGGWFDTAVNQSSLAVIGLPAR
jgi:peptide/nickel transport system permease protein